MKKILAFLFAVLMLASCAYADETAEITYQGIPWGSSVETVKKWAKDQGFKFINDYSGILDYLDCFLRFIKVTAHAPAKSRIISADAMREKVSPFIMLSGANSNTISPSPAGRARPLSM